MADAPTLDCHVDWALELTSIPTAAGREQRVMAWLERWIHEREDLALTRDPSGNMSVAFRDEGEASPGRPLYFTAHLDHPAFVVERSLGDSAVEAGFRGGVMGAYFDNARVEILGAQDGQRATGTIAERLSEGEPFNRYLIETDEPAPWARPGDIARWDLGPARAENGVLKTPACDDLLALGASLAAMDAIRARRSAGERTEPLRLLFTRADEIGFVGAIGAARDGTIDPSSRVIALENSRAFADAPMGAGPIVRVGDRINVFSPTLTAQVARRAEEVMGRPALPVATKTDAEITGRPWQRKLMAGGACEASVFCARGLEATCVCLPLGNYHNMGELDRVQSGAWDANERGAPPVALEEVAQSDYEGLVALLVGLGERMPGEGGSFNDRLDDLWAKRSFVLEG